MLFNSINFLIFFPVVTTLFFLAPQKARWLVLLAASCFFYMAFMPAFILILAFTILVDYVAGIYIERSVEKRRLIFLIASIVANVGVLFVFKYFNFFNANLASLADFLHWQYSLEALSIVLPIGLSFHTFQSLSYTIEVYRGRQKAERHLGILGTYVMFYPQLVAGPIERPQNLLHQFRERYAFELRRVGAGLSLMLFGFFKKIVIADNLAPFVNQAYASPAEYSGIALAIATVFFAFQIYCDFSGYSDIAVGSAKVMGFTLMQNFRHPYFARSVGEFWQRWHISLSTWFRDYVYIPLGGNRVSSLITNRNILITFFLSGVWHGANWTYVLWGLLNGMMLIVERFIYHSGSFLHSGTLRLRSFIGAPIQVLTTFTLICFAWIYFRASTLADAQLIAGKILSDWYSVGEKFVGASFLQTQVFFGRSHYDFYWCIVGIAILLVADFVQERRLLPTIFSPQRPVTAAILAWFVVSTAMLLIIVLGRTDSSQFIYFQF